MRYLLSIIICLWAGCALAFPPGFIGAVCGDGSTAGSSCSSTPSIANDNHATAALLGNTLYYVGIYVSDPLGEFTPCAVEFYMRENGSLAGKTLYVEKWSITSGVGLVSKLADLGTVSASDLSSTIGYYKITLTNPQTISNGQALVFTLNETTGATNNITFGDGSSIATPYIKSFTANSSKAIVLDTTVDMRMKIYE